MSARDREHALRVLRRRSPCPLCAGGGRVVVSEHKPRLHPFAPTERETR